MVNELLNLISETLDEKDIRHFRAEGERIIVRFDNDDIVCMYRVTEAGVIFRSFYDLGKNVAEESRGNVLECVNSINLSIIEGTVCIDEDGGIVYSAFIEYVGLDSIMKKRVLRVLRTALETEKNYLADIRNVIVDVSINPIMVFISLGLSIILFILTLIRYNSKELI
mgnify:CR=1 FL=1